MNASAPRQTALHSVHEALGAVFTDFGGWDMPLKYDNDLTEHQAVREAAGLFDLSHMGEVRITGPDAVALLDRALVSAFGTLAVGRAKYSAMPRQDGGLVDDLITYRLGEQEYLVVPNAANAQQVVQEFQQRAQDLQVQVLDESEQTSLVALQGPKSAAILSTVLEQLDLADGSSELSDLKYYAAAPAVVGGIPVLLARTGYTGEDGFELYVPNDQAVALWNLLTRASEGEGVVPAGLAARDSLRLEAGMPLYGHELGPQTSPFDAGLGRLVEAALRQKGDFVGRAALERAAQEHQQGRGRELIGLKGLTKRPARAGSQLVDDQGQVIGEVTSGIPSPTLGHPIAMASVERGRVAVGDSVEVDIRGKKNTFEVVELPFYRRSH